MSCRDCVFRSTYQDMGASADVCTLHYDLARAINACVHSEDCKYRFTIKEAKEIVFERTGGKPTDEPTAAERREESGDPEKDFNSAMMSIGEAVKRSLNELAKEMKDFVKRIEKEQYK